MNFVHDEVLVRAHMIEHEREAGLCIPHNPLPSTQRCERRCAFVAMQIDHKIVLVFAQAACKAQNAQKAVVASLLVNKEAVIDVAVFLHDIRELQISEQCDMRSRIVVTDGTQDRRHEHEVAKVHEVDNENVLI